MNLISSGEEEALRKRFKSKRKYWDHELRVRIQKSKRVAKWKKRQTQYLHDLTFGRIAGKFLPASNSRVQNGASDLLFEIVEAWTKKEPWRRVGSEKLRLATFIFNDAFVEAAAPEIFLYRIKDRIRNALYEAKLHGVMFLEFEYTKVPTEPGHSSTAKICVHAHGWIWPGDKNFKRREVERLLNEKRGFEPIFGKPSVKLKSKKAHVRESLVKMSEYVLKRPGGIKRISRKAGEDGKITYRIRHNMDDWSGDIAVRMMELYSQLDITELCFAVGDGKHLRSAWKSKMREEFRHAKGKHIDADEIGIFWNKVRKSKSKKPMAPIVFHRDNPTPVNRSPKIGRY